MDNIKDASKLIAYFIIIVLAIVGLKSLLIRPADKSSLPVEEITHIDSLVSVNDSIKIVVEHLDSVKNAKVIEVKSLDNDSTLSLFYMLLSK